jgi:hypothetical protein
MLNEPGMCSMTYFFAVLLPSDEGFQKQYARAMDLRNDAWADEIIDIADDASDAQEVRREGRAEAYRGWRKSRGPYVHAKIDNS